MILPTAEERARNRHECGCSLCDAEHDDGAEEIHPGGFPLMGDYPSLRHPPHQAPWHLLLDSCVVQNLSWAQASAPALDDELGWRRLDQRYGVTLGRELRAAVGLANAIVLGSAGHYPFLVGRSSWHELSAATGRRGERARDEWRSIRAKAETYDDTSPWRVPYALFKAMPEELRWPTPGQLCFPRLGDGLGDPGTSGPIADAGDRMLIAEARRHGIPAILTTDLRTFWRHRDWLYRSGVEIWRPSDLCWALLNDLCLYNGEGMSPTWPVRHPWAAERAA